MPNFDFSSATYGFRVRLRNATDRHRTWLHQRDTVKEPGARHGSAAEVLRALTALEIGNT